ncbi:MAG TPA: hypothetical protein VGJ20_37250 [Xanthobacteraceae bacterium]|jgi:hypothetical protein
MNTYAARLLILASAFVIFAIAAVPSAKAQSKFDGEWSAVLVTKSGPCDPAYRGAVQVMNGVVGVEGGNNVLSGRVSPNGVVTVRGNLGPNVGTAWGRLSGDAGTGRWRVHMRNGRCSGVWTARRR